jgi:metal-dependent amidase/aminoacylase/carboxypeptidase family protein
MVPTLKRVATADSVSIGQPTTTSEDFSLFEEKVPGLFFFLGVTPRDADPATVAANHSPRFFADEAALPVGVRLLASLAVDYLLGAK